MASYASAARKLVKGVVGGLAGLALVTSASPIVSAQSADTPSSADSVGNPAVFDGGSVEGSLAQFEEHGPFGSIPDPLGPVGSLRGVPSGSIAGSSYLSNIFPLGSVLAGVDAVGSGEFPRPGTSPSQPVNTRDNSIEETELRDVRPLYSEADRETNPQLDRAEVWTVTSESMQREVRLEVYHAPAGVEQAPIVYFLPGVGGEAPSFFSGVFGFNNPEALARPVTVVAPTGAPSSMFADWIDDDPVLGPNMWETFLTDELPGLLDEAESIRHNGHYGTIGLSMGGGPAVHLLNRHPGMFGAAAGISSCYSSTDPIGYQYHRLTAEARGGDATNMWGPRNSAQWQRHDTKSDPSGLAGKRVYLSAATGFIGSTDFNVFGSEELILTEGHLLERGAYECTVAFEQTLRDEGVDHRVDYEPFGIHNWPVFGPPLNPAMEYMMPALGPVTGPATAAASPFGAAGTGSSTGSTRSAGAGN